MLPRSLLACVMLTLVVAGCGKAKEDVETTGGIPKPAPHLEFVEGPLPTGAVHGQVIYVPIYSSIYSHSGKRIIELTATLSMHNTDSK